MPRREWLDPPPAGTQVCGGLDGSENDDRTAIKLETHGGFLFTPRWGPDRRPTIWNPAQHCGRIPRRQVHEAWAELNETYRLRRVYCDPGFNDEPGGPETYVFEEHDGKTTITSKAVFPSKEARDAALDTGMETGAAETYDRLDEYLEVLTANRTN